MTDFRTVRKNGVKRVIPIHSSKRTGISRKVTLQEIKSISPSVADRVVRGSGFHSDSYDPFDFKGNPQDFSVNGMRLDGIDEIYLGEETASFYRYGKLVSSIFYNDFREFHPGGKIRIGGN